MANIDETNGLAPVAASGGRHFWWGVLLIIAGILAVLMPEIAAFATVIVLAWILIISGIFEIAYALHTREHGSFGWKLASGIVTLLLGIALLVSPASGAAALGLIVGVFLFVGGVVRVSLAVGLRPRRGWGWVLFDGILAIVLAIIIAVGFPHSSIAIIGLLVGFTLIVAGIWRVAFSRYTIA